MKYFKVQLFVETSDAPYYNEDYIAKQISSGISVISNMKTFPNDDWRDILVRDAKDWLNTGKSK